MGVFHLSATDGGGAAVHQFAQPLTLAHRYTPEQLQARGIAESDLTLFTYDPTATVTLANGLTQQGRWVALPTHIDRATHTATAPVHHFSAFQLGDGSSPSTAYIPSVKEGQVDLFTGRAAWSMPIEVPTGPGGIAPQLSLGYKSDQTDGPVGKSQYHQAPWVGKGFNLDTGSIGLEKTLDGASLSYSLILNGRSFSLIRLDHAAPQPAKSQLDAWDWHATDESFVKVRAVKLPALAGRGGADAANPTYQRWGWRIWAKDGTRYEFDDDQWWGWDNCDPAIFNPPTAFMETYKWNLTKVVDTHSNAIAYTYAHDTLQPGATTCNGMNGTVDQASYPASITWGANATAGTGDHYKVAFNTVARTFDTLHGSAANQYGGNAGAPQETRYLGSIQVLDAQDGATWQLIRQYNFGYLSTLLADTPNATFAKLTLHSIDRIGSDGITALPQILFDYGAGPGPGPRLADGANRLASIANGQGGTIAFAYQNIANAINNDGFDNFQRVTTVTVTDRGAPVGQWRYDYTNPELNSLGTQLAAAGGFADNDPQTYPNSAKLYLNTWFSFPAPDRLVVPKHAEFRGHKTVTVTDPNGNATTHWFYQGDEAGCAPNPAVANGNAIINDSCFVQIRDNEIRAGREYQTEVYRAAAGSALLSRTARTFVVFFDQYTTDSLSGVWHFARFNDAKTSTLFEGGATGLGRITTYAYDGFGNLATTKEFADTNTGGAPYRRTERQYATLDTVASGGSGSYVVDRVKQIQVFDGQNAELARAQTFYDGQALGALTGKGEVTQVRAFFDLAGGQGSDATYGYDAYGNRTSATTYTGANGAAGTGRTTTTAYDATFHDLPTSVTSPTANGVTLVEQAAYDPRMRTLTSVTDPNGAVTGATYDLFGRMVNLTRPGESAGIVTVHTDYYDNVQPVQVVVSRASANGSEPTSRFYDGLGRLIQTKRVSQANAQNIVADTRYDGLGNVVQASQPRYVSETPADTFWAYDPPGAGPLWTTATYDALSRPLVVTAPDGTTTQAAYSRNATGGVVATTDANGHRTDRATDLFGRLTTVIEQSGNGGTEGPYATYATTTYQYSPLDLLTKTTDAAGNVTTPSYDALGRTTGIADPDLGAWQYQYDAAGNLTRQTDARGQITGLGYDSLDRLINRTGAETASFTYDAGTNGKGRRTGMTNASGATSWAYDSRGRVTSATVSGVPGTTASWAVASNYDSADRLITLTYPTNEAVAYAYDPAGRPISLCPAPAPAPPPRRAPAAAPAVALAIATLPPSRGGTPCYAQGATYSALDQPTARTTGDTLTEQWSYAAPLQRLQRHQVGTTAAPSSVDDRSYTYDRIGNVATLHDGVAAVDQRFTYDHRDRLVHACTASPAPASPCDSALPGGYDETDQYDTLGDLTTKGGTAATFPAPGSPHPHAPTTVGGAPFAYDAAGNLTSGGGRTLTWDGRNRPASVTAQATTETYSYDADGTRLTRTASGITTVYVLGLYEVDIQGTTILATRSQYPFAGGIIAQKGSAGTNPLVYLHGDHLGSISVATLPTGAVLDRQEYGPWGNVRSGGIAETTLNYTGQKRDGTGLLYYGARYYDPALGRFLSPDSLGVHLGNPQSLNRYAYVGNNPLNHTDPTGHCNDDAGCNDHYGNDEGPTPLDNGGGNDYGGGDSGGRDPGDNEPSFHIESSPGPFPTGDGTLITPGGPSVIPGSTGGSPSGGFTLPGSTGKTNPDGFALPGWTGGTVPYDFTSNGILASTSGPPINANGTPYPTVHDPDGNPVPYNGGTPGNPVPGPERAPRDQTAVDQYKKEWESQHGGQPPPGGWWDGTTGDWQVHHIVPIMYGGDNSPQNLVPVRGGPDHQSLTNWWRNL